MAADPSVTVSRRNLAWPANEALQTGRLRLEPLTVDHAVQVATGSPTLEASIAWVISPNSQGRGMATEAAGAMIDWLTAHEVLRFAAYAQY